MSWSGGQWHIVALTTLFSLFTSRALGEDIYLRWNVSFNSTIMPLGVDQSVITVNGAFPGPLINVTTNDKVYINVFNNLDELFLFTWNGIQQRQNSWQDGVSGTNCPIQPGTNWTYEFQTKDQIGSFFYFPSINFLKAAGGFGPIRVNNRKVIPVPFDKPDGDFDLLIGDWSSSSYKDMRKLVGTKLNVSTILMNGKPPYNVENKSNSNFESISVVQGKTYRFRISNVGTSMSFNFRIQNHQMMLVETEGAYTNRITLDSLDVHVGQSYSVLVKADQNDSAYYMVATPTQVNSSIFGLGVLQYAGSTTPPAGSYPSGPNSTDQTLSVNQAKLIRLNMSAGAARSNPQGKFNVQTMNINHTFVLKISMALIEQITRYTINNVSYFTPETPLNLADHFHDGSKVLDADMLLTHSVNKIAIRKTFVVTGNYKEWLEIVFKNDMDTMDSWHLDGYAFFVVGFGSGDWNPGLRSSDYNIQDPVVRSTVQVYPGMWTAVYVYVDNLGMWNLRSQVLENWCFGQEMYIKVRDPGNNSSIEISPPKNIIRCDIYQKDTSGTSRCSSKKANSYLVAAVLVLLAAWFNL